MSSTEASKATDESRNAGTSKTTEDKGTVEEAKLPDTPKSATIYGDMERHAGAFLEACRGSDVPVNGLLTGTMLHFLQTKDLPSYYQIKANIILAATREEDESWEDISKAKHCLRDAGEALKVARQTYQEPGDVKQLDDLEEAIKEEWEEVKRYERKTDPDIIDSDDENPYY